MPTLLHHLLGQTRSAVLGALLSRPEVALHVRELARLTGASAGSLHRELRALAELGLLLRQEVGHQVHYRANTAHPVYAELAALVRKTSGLADILRDALAPLEARVELAFVYGSMAAGRARAGSDVDLMVIGTASFGDLARALAPAQTALGREVNPTVFSRAQASQAVRKRDGFWLDVARGPKVWLKGGDSDLAELAEDRPAEGARGHAGRGAKAAGSGGSQPRADRTVSAPATRTLTRHRARRRKSAVR